MKERYGGYINLIVAVTGCERNDVLPLNKKDAKEIDTLLDSLPNGRTSRCSLAKAVSLRFGLHRWGEKCTLKSAGMWAGVSPAAIRIKEVVALRKLRHPSRIRHLRKFSRSFIENENENEMAIYRQRNSSLVEKNEKLEEENEKLRLIIHQIHALIAPMMPPMMSVSAVEEILSNMSVDKLELSVRASNCLRKSNIKTLGELTQMRETDLLRSKNFGRKSLNEIKELLSEKGLALKC